MEENENRARLKALSAMLNDEGSRKLIFLISAVMQKKIIIMCFCPVGMERN